MQRVVFAAIHIALVALGSAAAGAQDAALGEKAFAWCSGCHEVGDSAKNSVGPILNGLFGRKAAAVEGFAYSSAMKASGLTWDDATFLEYITAPRETVPGTTMLFAGMKGAQQKKRIKDLAAYLHQFDKTPVKLVP